MILPFTQEMLFLVATFGAAAAFDWVALVAGAAASLFSPALI